MPGDIAKKHLFLTFAANLAFSVIFFTLFHLPPIRLNCDGAGGLNSELVPEWGLDPSYPQSRQSAELFLQSSEFGLLQPLTRR